MSKKVSKTTLKLNARLKCIPKYYAMNIATLEKEIQKKDKCTLEELKNNITAKQFKVKAKEEKIKKYSTMKKEELYDALHKTVPKNNDWFDYLHKILKKQIEQTPKRKRTSKSQTPATPRKKTPKKKTPATPKKKTPKKKTPATPRKKTPKKKTPKKKTPATPRKKTPKTKTEALVVESITDSEDAPMTPKPMNKKQTLNKKKNGAIVKLLPPSELTETSTLPNDDSLSIESIDIKT